jgi:hypothetical protein
MESAPHVNNLPEAAALLFVDALGGQIPLKASYGIHELVEGLAKIGVVGLSDDEVVQVATEVEALTDGNVKVGTVSYKGVKLPLSRNLIADRAIDVGTWVVLKDGREAHVVDIIEDAPGKTTYLGMDDNMELFEFELKDIATAMSLPYELPSTGR